MNAGDTSNRQGQRTERVKHSDNGEFHLIGDDEDSKPVSKGAGKAGKTSRQKGQLRDPPSMAQLEPNVNEHDPKRNALDPEETRNILMLNAEEEEGYTEEDAASLEVATPKAFANEMDGR